MTHYDIVYTILLYYGNVHNNISITIHDHEFMASTIDVSIKLRHVLQSSSSGMYYSLHNSCFKPII